MSETSVALLFLLIVPLLWGLMWLGWRGRGRRQSSLPPLPAVPAGGVGTPVLDDLRAVYVSTTSAGRWLDRVVAQGLGTRSEAAVRVTPEGVHIVRVGAPDLWIPTASLDDVRLERAIAGKVVEKEGLVVLTWRLGTARLDTGLRLRYEADRARLVEAVRSLKGAAA